MWPDKLGECRRRGRTGRLGKIILGLLTLLAPVTLVASPIVGYFYLSGVMRAHGDVSLYWRVYSVLQILLLWGVWLFYVVHAWRTTCVPPEKRRLWLVLVLVLNLLIDPLYWYRFIWKGNQR